MIKTIKVENSINNAAKNNNENFDLIIKKCINLNLKIEEYKVIFINFLFEKYNCFDKVQELTFLSFNELYKIKNNFNKIKNKYEKLNLVKDINLNKFYTPDIFENYFIKYQNQHD